MNAVSNMVKFKIWPFSTTLKSSDLFLTFIILLWDQNKAVKELWSVYVCVDSDDQLCLVPCKGQRKDPFSSHLAYFL